ncbi:hypothetical protein Tco_1499710 [Tanacetum coccineum]
MTTISLMDLVFVTVTKWKGSAFASSVCSVANGKGKGKVTVDGFSGKGKTIDFSDVSNPDDVFSGKGKNVDVSDVSKPIVCSGQYRMVFVPFTGIDNHNRSVTFGAGLFSDETVKSMMARATVMSSNSAFIEFEALHIRYYHRWRTPTPPPASWVVDFFRLQEPNSPEATPASPDYVPDPKEPEQAPLLPDYVPGPEYPEYLAPSDEEVPVEDQPYAVVDSPIALSPGYVADSDPEEDPEEELLRRRRRLLGRGGPEEEEEGASNLATLIVAPVVDHVPSFEETEPFETDESAATPPSPPACQERLARCLAAPALPSSPLPRLPHPYGSPNTGVHTQASELPMCSLRYKVGRVRRCPQAYWRIRDTWVDPRETTEEICTVLEGVTLGRLRHWSMIVGTIMRPPTLGPGGLVSHESLGHTYRISFGGHMATALGEIWALQAREQARADAPEGTETTCHQKNLQTARTTRVVAVLLRTAVSCYHNVMMTLSNWSLDRVSAALDNHGHSRNRTHDNGMAMEATILALQEPEELRALRVSVRTKIS